MLGFAIGSICLVALVALVSRGRRRRHWARYGSPYGTFGPGWAGPGRRVVLRRVFQRLDTPPGQEKAIVGALGELRVTASGLRDEARQLRAEVAGSLRGERLADADLGDILARRDGTLRTLRDASVRAMRTIHEALDARQRGELADLIESGHGLRGRCG